MATRSRESETDRRRSPHDDESRSGNSTVKRVVVGLVGGLLVARGLRRRSLTGVGMAAVGGWLVSRAIGLGSGDRSSIDLPSVGSDLIRQTGETGRTAVSHAITIGRPAEELYEAWRDPEQFSQVVGNVADVTSQGEDRFRWTVHGPFGQDVSWETHVVEAEPGERLRWETPPDAVVPNSGTVRFRRAPGDRGTVVELSVEFDPPGGTFGNAALQRLDVLPESLASQTLHRFKSLVEAGEIPTLEENPSARGSGDLL